VGPQKAFGLAATTEQAAHGARPAHRKGVLQHVQAALAQVALFLQACQLQLRQLQLLLAFSMQRLQVGRLLSRLNQFFLHLAQLLPAGGLLRLQRFLHLAQLLLVGGLLRLQRFLHLSQLLLGGPSWSCWCC